MPPKTQTAAELKAQEEAELKAKEEAELKAKEEAENEAENEAEATEEQQENIALKFLMPWGLYNKGEIAGFRPKQAQTFIDKKIAAAIK